MLARGDYYLSFDFLRLTSRHSCKLFALHIFNRATLSPPQPFNLRYDFP